MSFQFNQGEYRLSGHLVLNKVASIHNELKKNWLQGEGDIIVNLDDVEKADSSILALLLEWKAQANKKNRRFKIKSLPPSLQTLSEMSGVDKILLET